MASFSMAKSVQSMLVGMAIEDGLIGFINDPIVNYLPYLGDNDLSGVTIQHLLNMTSGIDFNESYTNPFGQAAAFYYGRNLRREVTNANRHTHPAPTSATAAATANCSDWCWIAPWARKPFPITWSANYGSRWAWNFPPPGAWIRRKKAWKKPSAASMPAPVILPNWAAST